MYARQDALLFAARRHRNDYPCAIQTPAHLLDDIAADSEDNVTKETVVQACCPALPSPTSPSYVFVLPSRFPAMHADFAKQDFFWPAAVPRIFPPVRQIKLAATARAANNQAVSDLRLL